MERTIEIIAINVRVDPSSNRSIAVSFDMYDSYIPDLINGIPEPLIMDCWDKKEIAQYLIDNGYEVKEI